MDTSYELVDVPDDQAPPQNCSIRESMYAVPIASQVEKLNYYDLPHVKTSLAKIKPVSEVVKKVNTIRPDEEAKEVTRYWKSTCRLIILSLLIAATLILTLAALSLGVHNLIKDEHKEDSSVKTGAEVISEETANYSQLINEMQELKLQLQQLASDVKRNTSQLESQLDLARYDITQVSHDITRIDSRLGNSQNLYQSCRKDRTMCSLPNLGSTIPYCLTPTQTKNISVRY